ncbi:hypothetical protein D9615_002397 [Tricholomella constricta]|uniref:Uncharacterized protein n=1 Tax=Tricholomella constricta TaxID=117010 RepID=A0A8H5HM57_9AGAR|nr:hypothetical protein D9615_002397 [Tricholomella constricta]
MNPTSLIDSSFGLLAATNVTNDPEYAKIVSVIDRVRQALCNESAFRKPFHEVLLNLYTSPSMSAKIPKIHPVPPTPQDVLDFFTSSWPEVRLMPYIKTETEYVWGYTHVGPQASNDSGIHISFPLVQFWSNMATSQNPTKFTVNIAASIFVTVLLYELSHCLIVWWSEGTCCTPKDLPILGESGEFIERELLGGVLEGWWQKDHVGTFSHLEQVAFEAAPGKLYVLDNACALHILQCFASASSASPSSMPPVLPLLQVQSMASTPPPNPLNVSRAKFATLRRGAKEEPAAAQPTTPAFVKGLGLVRRSAMAGDKFFLGPK